MSKMLGIAFAALAFSATTQAATVTVEAFDNATVQPGGPRGGSSGKAFFNIEGANLGNFASYGVTRFDLGAAKSGFDADFGVAGWRIDSVTLLLTQSNASFTADGTVGIRHTDADLADIQRGTSVLAYPVDGDFTDLVALGDYAFVETATGAIERHTLFERGGVDHSGSGRLVDDLLTDTLLTLVLVDLSPGVAATYAGSTDFTLAGPSLEIAVSAVPVPAALPLFGSALLAVPVLRRRLRDRQ
jgi:hypothetical protein